MAPLGAVPKAARRARIVHGSSATRLLTALAIACCVCAGGVGPSAAVTPSVLCSRSAFLPPPVRLPSFAPTDAFSFYSEEASTDALAHHVLCRVEITTPHSSPPYLYHLSWEVFPTRADAVADLADVNLSSIYRSPRVTKPVPGFPSPNEIVTGLFLGQPITVVIFIDGPALVSGYVLGGGTLGQAEALARWEATDIRHFHLRG